MLRGSVARPCQRDVAHFQFPPVSDRVKRAPFGGHPSNCHATQSTDVVDGRGAGTTTLDCGISSAGNAQPWQNEKSRTPKTIWVLVKSAGFGLIPEHELNIAAKLDKQINCEPTMFGGLESYSQPYVCAFMSKPNTNLWRDQMVFSDDERSWTRFIRREPF